MRAWNLLVLLTALGCGTPVETEDQPPTLLRVDPEAGDVQMGPAGRTIFIFAEDPEGEALDFVWASSVDGVLPGAYPVEEGDGSQIELEPDIGDGTEVTCHISDGVNDIDLSWLIEVVE